MEEESSKKFQTLINYEKLNELINSDNKTKDYMIENNHEEFNKIYNILSGKIELPNVFNLISDYRDMNIKTKFQLFEKIQFVKLFKKGKDICIYYFIYKQNYYIFLPKDKKIFKLKHYNRMDNLFYLKEYIDISYLKKIQSACQNNSNIKIINNQIKDYYLINRKLLNFQLQEYCKIENNKEIKHLNEYNCETIVPELKKKNNFTYPVDFYFLEKEEYSFEILELSKMIKSEDLSEYKIFFVFDNNLIKEKTNIYIGLINNKDIKLNKIFSIYFYLVKNNKFEIEYIVNYYKEERMFKEIKDNIMTNGIEVYLNIMSNNHENNDIEQKPLYDIDLNNIGFYINLNNKKINNIKIKEYSKSLEYIPNTYFFFGVIQCLVNIKHLREIFLNKQFLIDKKIIENSPITKKLYQIFQYKWYWTNNCEVYDSLIYDINNEDSNIFNNCKLLIEFLLLHIHNEQRKEKKENFIKLDSLIYNGIDKMKKEFYKNNKTIIQKLFFFETKHICYCGECECQDYPNYRINCALEFPLETNKKEIRINNLLDDLSQRHMCEICKQKTLQIITKLNTCPLFLIIVIKNNNNLKINFNYTEKIELKNYVTKENNDSSEYDLISFIKNPPLEEEKKEGIIYCKSPVNDEWYKYKGFKVEKTNISDIIKNEKSIPHLLIYKNKITSFFNINQLFC